MRQATLSSLFTLFLLAAPAAWAQQSPAPASAQEVDNLRQEVESLRKGQANILRRLKEIQRQIAQQGRQGRGRRQPPPFDGAEVTLAGAAVLGVADAPLTMVEFSDYQCPFCKRYADTTLPQLLKDYVDTGKLRYVYMDYPIERIHPQALEAAVAARCAGRQEKYWLMHDRIFAEARLVKARKWAALAAPLELDNAAFETCMAEPEHAKAVRQSITIGSNAGVTGTPAFFLGTQVKDGKLAATRMIRGARPLAAFKRAIDELLAAKN